MRYRFSNEARQALAAAREEALKLRHGSVAPGHILLGMLDRGMLERWTGRAVRVALKERLAGVLPTPEAESPSPTTLPYTGGAKSVLERAIWRARDRGAREVGVEDLFAGVLAVEPAVAKALREAGVEVGPELAPGAGAGRSEEEPVWFLEVDADGEMPLYEQIVEKVKEAVATGRLKEGERLPPVRQLAAELGIAPGTVARAYSALEGLGVVVTEGARGTRVAPPEAGAMPAEGRLSTLEGLLRPVVIAAFHLGARIDDVRQALERAMEGVYEDPGGQARA